MSMRRHPVAMRHAAPHVRQPHAHPLMQRHRLSFPVAYGLHAHEIVEQVGAYTGEHEVAYLQSTNFVLKPDGSVALALYSSGAVGRLSAGDTLKFITYLRQ